MCDCINISFQSGTYSTLYFEVDASGTYNSYNTFEFIYFGTTYYIWYNGSSTWYISETIGSAPYIDSLKVTDPCPLGNTTEWLSFAVTTSTTECECAKNEDRMYFDYKSIKLPQICPPQDRGFEECCCEELVLAKSTSN